MRIFFSILAFLCFIFCFNHTVNCQAQKESTTQVVIRVSADWLKDSAFSLKFRYSALKDLIKSKPDGLRKEFLFKKLGHPNQISKFYSGNTNKNYVGFIYYVLPLIEYKRDKPFEGIYIQFVFDEKEECLLLIEEGDFCG